jgi:hypothetical protein
MSHNKDLLASVSDVSTESEFFSPVPKGYKIRRMGLGAPTRLVGKVEHACDGIDTPGQYAEFVKRYKNSRRE